MIEYKFGNIFSTSMNTIVCPVNTVGVMGAGLALTVKAVYPELFKTYKEFCKAGKLDIGKLYFSLGRRKNILLFPTKKHWKDYLEISWIEEGLKKFAENIESKGYYNTAFPMLGCGLGRADEDKVIDLFEKYLEPYPYVFEVWKHDPDSEDPVWNELYMKCEEEDTQFKRVVRECSNFYELSRYPGVGKDTFGKNVNSLLRYEC